MTHVKKRLIQLGLMAAISCLSSLVLAQSAEGKDGPHRPPPEALDACKSLSAGQDCSFNGPRGAVTGSCWAPEGKQLACKPKDGPGDRPAPKKQ